MMNSSADAPGPSWNAPPASPAEWAERLADILTLTACKTGTLHRVDPASGLLVMAAGIGIPDALLDKVSRIPVGKGIAGAAAERREPVQFCNIQMDTTGVVRPNARQTNVQGALAVPVLDGDRLLGVLGVGKQEPHDFTPEEIQTVQALAARLAAWLA